MTSTHHPYELPSDQVRHEQPQTPTISRDVHHVGPGSADGVYPPEARAGKITSVADAYTVGLVVWPNGGGAFYPQNVPYHPGDPAPDHELGWAVYFRDPIDGRAYPPGTWHWPPKA